MLPLGIYGQFSPVVVGETKLAEKQVEELITLINDLLDLEKLKAGQLEMRPTSSNLEDLLDAAIDSCAELAEERAVSLLFEGCSAPVMVQADGDRLKQALTKVLVSAIRLCPIGNAVNINVTTALDSGHRVALIELRIDRRISDEQISDDLLETIFEPFQATSLTAVSGGKSERSSLGLALPLAKAILLGFGGQCGVEQDGQGLVLWLQLPVAAN
jgi:signal transduction histidine kinase